MENDSDEYVDETEDENVAMSEAEELNQIIE